jgi:YfiH family protein
MRRLQHEGLQFLQFESIPSSQVIHGLFTRRGGTSKPPWDSLNVGSTVGDDPGAVAANRGRMFAALGRSSESRFDLWQVHQADIELATEPRHGSEPPRADGVITESPEVVLWMRFADCVPIVVVDPHRPAVGMAHAGWQGTAKRVAYALVQRMHHAFGSTPDELIAGIGPAIGQHHYPVGDDVLSAFESGWRRVPGSCFEWHDDVAHLDLAAANEHLLRAAGVQRIEQAEICTACHLDDWYSHRGERGRTGRFGAAIGLRPSNA